MVLADVRRFRLLFDNLMVKASVEVKIESAEEGVNTLSNSFESKTHAKHFPSPFKSHVDDSNERKRFARFVTSLEEITISATIDTLRRCWCFLVRIVGFRCGIGSGLVDAVDVFSVERTWPTLFDLSLIRVSFKGAVDSDEGFFERQSGLHTGSTVRTA